MKPISLSLENFRSYRKHEPIIFGDAALVALVGPTGAGKSSILEAMVYALYGQRSDSGQNKDELISFNETSMSVTFTFAVGGREYTVYRARRNGQALQRLTMPDGKSYAAMSEVDDSIAGLLGLTKDVFLKTVLLPQGRFDELLLETSGNRAKILAQVLGLGYLDAMNANAKVERDRALAIKSGAETARALLSEKPREELQRSQAALEAARGRSTSLQATVDEYRALEQSIAASAAVLAENQRSLVALAGVDIFASDLTSVRAKATDLASKIAGQVTALEAIEQEQTDRQAAVEARVNLDLEVSTLSAVAQTLVKLQGLFKAYDVDRERLDVAVVALTTRTVGLPAFEERHAKAMAALPLLETLLKAREQEHQGATDEERTLRTLRSSVDRLATDVARERLSQKNQAKTVGDAEKHLAAAEQVLAAARATVATSQADLRAAERAEAAAFLGVGLHPGDSCPVCAQTIPRGFKAKKAAHIEAARARLQDVQMSEQAAAVAATKVAGQAQSFRDAHRLQSERLAEAKAKLATAEAQLRNACVGPSYEEALAQQVLRIEEAAAAMHAARAAFNAGQTEISLAEQALANEREQLAAMARGVKDLKAALATRDKEIASHRKTLPKRWLPPTEASIDVLLEGITHEQRETEALAAGLREVEQRYAAATHQLAEMQIAYEREVNGPLGTLHARAQTLASLAKVPAPSPALQADDPYFDELLAAVAACRALLIQQQLEAEGQRLAAETQQEALVAAAGGGDIVALHGAALAEVVRYEAAVAAATAEAERVDKIEQTIAAATPVYAALDAVARYTASNQFPEFLTNQYVTRLLTLGSEYLYEMTGRFRFVPPHGHGRAADKDLRIRDFQTGATMPPDNLSGGEKFLTSLALSLAVVDQAALAGAQIDSLFLDEGFGSLDSEFLDKAMMELRMRARKGRAIWIITHLREVARYADRAYLVENDITGSKLRLTDGDVDEPVDAARLLTALT